MQFNRRGFTNEQLIHIYKKLLLPRMIEEKMLVLLRQGKISKWFSGIGQEAIAVGCTYALGSDEWIMPLHRNLGVFTTRNMPLHKLFMQWQGNKEGYSKGRERSFHFGSNEHYICGMISHLGPQLSIADGVSLAYQLKNEKKVSLAFTGEGGTSEGDFHEALNVAAVWNLPVIFLIENNGYGLSTPTAEQYACEHLVDKAKGYGMRGLRIDGNNILEVIETVSSIRTQCIAEGKPCLIECDTFRMRGHEEASGTKYVPPHLFDEWKKKDPISNYETFLLSEDIIRQQEVEDVKKSIKNYIEEELQLSNNTSPVQPDSEEEIRDVYASSAVNYCRPTAQVINDVFSIKTNQPTTDKRFVDAIKDGLYQSMQQHKNLVLMGQDIAEYGGAFKITEGFVQAFGKARVRNTPICESAIAGAALGLSLEGFKSVVEMQ
ncbi:MAG: thiamine pyrophosphate-dependent enzyme, partial [Bacteroidota bacterium]|nr:thiamine pyrophosphate-dependent enzyme [Bacteroidota bacterium]